MQPPDGPPVCTALNARPSGMPPPMSNDDLAQRDAHRHFDEAGVDDLAGEREDLGALALLGADGGEPVAAVADDRGDVGEGLDVVDQRRAAPQARSADTAGAGAAVPRSPSIEAISAVSSPQTNAPAPMRMSTSKLKRRPQMLLPRRPSCAGLADRRLQPADRQRILGADVDVALRCAPTA